MAGFTDLVLAAQPYLAEVNAAGTEGRTWRWQVEVVDADGTFVDLSTGYTAACQVLTEDAGDVVATINVGLATPGLLVLSLDESLTVGLSNGSKRRCRWQLVVTETATSDSVQFWHPSQSLFDIYPDRG